MSKPLAKLDAVVATMLSVLSPISPFDWWRYARALAAAHGWMPSMLLWATFGVALFLNLGFGRRQNLPWLEYFNWLTWATWAIVAVFAMVVTTGQSLRSVMRLGLRGPQRPRWWFELARTTWNAATIAIVGMLIGLFMNQQQQRLLEPFFSFLFVAFRVAAPSFLVLATMGYLLSFALGYPRTGRAYDCVHYFYSICGSIGLVTYAAIMCPVQPNARDMLFSALLGTIGIVWLVFSFISIVRRFEKWERNQDAA